MSFLPARLIKLREFKGLSSNGLATLADLDPAAVLKLEKGKVVNPRSDTLEKLARALDVLPGFFMGYGKDFPIREAAVMQALQRFLQTEGIGLAADEVSALECAATYVDAPNTAAQWKVFVAMRALADGRPVISFARATAAATPSNGRSLQALEGGRARATPVEPPAKKTD